MINIGKEWRWMDDEEWDHYSGLPSPAAYEQDRSEGEGALTSLSNEVSTRESNKVIFVPSNPKK